MAIDAATRPSRHGPSVGASNDVLSAVVKSSSSSVISAEWSRSPRPSATRRSNSSATTENTGSFEAELLGGVEDDVGVLRVEDRPPARDEITGEHLPAVDLEDAARGVATRQRCPDDGRIDAGGPRERQPLGDGRDRGADDELVARLRDLSSARAADVDDRAPHCREDRLGPLERLDVAADHDRQRSFDRSDLAAGNRSVEEADAMPGAAFCEWRHRGRVMGTHRGHDEPFAAAGEDAVRAVEDRLHVRRVRDHDDDDIAATGDVTRRRHCSGAGGDEEFDRGSRPRMDGERKPCGHDPARHRSTHHAEADEPDVENRRGATLRRRLAAHARQHRTGEQTFAPARDGLRGIPRDGIMSP